MGSRPWPTPSEEETPVPHQCGRYLSQEATAVLRWIVVRIALPGLFPWCSLSDECASRFVFGLCGETRVFPWILPGALPPSPFVHSKRLSGCLVTEEGCKSLVSAFSSSSSHLKELDLSYNNPGEAGVKMLEQLRLDTLRVEPAGVRWLRPGLRKYSCQLTIDTNTVNTKLQLSDNNRKVTRVEEVQSYPDHPDRFDVCEQLLCRDGLTGRCYWEVEWTRRA
ncbi:tripartite motif-containing protein 16-like [Maylandia zebra]|uniref:tripartite motif-containing protein 16-like n=1 Tax=Maylandia zebra TaxID=106582 RepID=UPI00403C832D